MFKPTIIVVWKYTLLTIAASSRSCWRYLYTFMLFLFFPRNYLFTFWMENILFMVLAFLQKMVFNISNFDNLIALPTIGQHGTVSEIMHINSLLIKIRFQTKITSFHFFLLTITIIGYMTTSFSTLCCILFRFLLNWLVNISFNNLRGTRHLLFWYFGWFLIINFLKASHKSINTCLPNSFKMNRNLIWTHSLIQFTKTIISRCTNIIICVLNSLYSIFYCSYLLLWIKLISL